MRIINYTILFNGNITELIKEVNKLIKDGWEPLGAMIYSGTNDLRYQTMILKEEDEDD